MNCILIYECNSGNLRWVKLTLLFLQRRFSLVDYDEVYESLICVSGFG